MNGFINVGSRNDIYLIQDLINIQTERQSMTITSLSLHTIHLTPNEHAYLLRLLGGASDQGIKTLGEGLNALGVIELRKKMEAVG